MYDAQTRPTDEEVTATAGTPGEIVTGAEVLVRALRDQGVTSIFGYPGGAVLPIYDAIFQQDVVEHVLVRHEQGAGHMAEGYARSTGKCGVCLVTSGPGATNTVTPLVDALMDSIPMVCITGQVPTHLIGSDAFQECDTTGITRSATKHNYLVKDVNDLERIVHEAFHVATSGRPGPVVIDIPKDVQFKQTIYRGKPVEPPGRYRPRTAPDLAAIDAAVALMRTAKKPVLYTGGGVINAGPEASTLLRQLAHATGFPVTSTLMGLGAFPASDPQWLGMLGMHGAYEANMVMHDCDVMVCIGARFDDRVTGRLDAFSPNSKKIHIDIDPSSINKNVRVDVGIIADAGQATAALLARWNSAVGRKAHIDAWWAQIEAWRARNGFGYRASDDVIKPQYAVQRLHALTKDRETYITTEVGQHQMWAAQFYHFEEPNRWMTSGGLGTMGYGLPAAIGVQQAHRDALVIDIAGEASIQMCMQEMSCAVQHNLPVKVFILNNEWMGMVRQWQQLLHGERYSHSYSEALPDFVKMAEAFGAKGIRCDKPGDLDAAIQAMIDHPGPVLFDCRVVKEENCFPMIPSGAAHNEMLLGDDGRRGGSWCDEGEGARSTCCAPESLPLHRLRQHRIHPALPASATGFEGLHHFSIQPQGDLFLGGAAQRRATHAGQCAFSGLHDATIVANFSAFEKIRGEQRRVIRVSPV
jgi:acetolactate synthase I/II/III large subunit